MQWKRILLYLAIGIIGILLINLIASNSLLIEKGVSEIDITKAIALHILGTLYCFLLGVLLEWRIIEKLIKKEAKLGFSPLLIPGIIILLIGAIPPIMIAILFGIHFPFPEGTTILSFFIGPLSHSSKIQNLLAVIAGSIITKSLTRNTC